MKSFTLLSNDLEGQLADTQVFSRGNTSPQLSWKNPPAETKSFALTVYDPDAPTGSGWWHWLVFNISKKISQLEANAGAAGGENLPSGAIQSLNSYGEVDFGGAAPPPDDKAHAYIFTIYALDVEKLDLDKNATPAMVGFNLNAHFIAKASLISYFAF